MARLLDDPQPHKEVIAMPFTILFRAIGNADEQLLFATVVWLMALLIAGFAFRRFARTA